MQRISDRIKELAPKDETKDKTAEVIKKPVAVKYSSAIVQLAKNIKGISDDEMHKKLSNLNHSEMTVLQKLIRWKFVLSSEFSLKDTLW